MPSKKRRQRPQTSEAKAKHAKYMRDYYRRNPGKKKDCVLRRMYGISLEEFEALSALQGGRCAICDQVAPLVVDHCHESKMVRGLLCGCCNSAIGMLREDRSIFLSAMRYLGIG